MNNRSLARFVVPIALAGALILAFWLPINPSWAHTLGSSAAVRIGIGGVAFVVTTLIAGFAVRLLLDGFPDSIGGGLFSVEWSADVTDLNDRLAKQERLVAEIAELIADQDRTLQALQIGVIGQARPQGDTDEQTEQRA